MQSGPSNGPSGPSGSSGLSGSSGPSGPSGPSGTGGEVNVVNAFNDTLQSVAPNGFVQFPSGGFTGTAINFNFLNGTAFFNQLGRYKITYGLKVLGPSNSPFRALLAGLPIPASRHNFRSQIDTTNTYRMETIEFVIGVTTLGDSLTIQNNSNNNVTIGDPPETGVPDAVSAYVVIERLGD